MPKLVLVGINHSTPLGPRVLHEKLNEIDQRYGTPSFVGVEWGQAVHEKVKKQRCKFRNLFQREFLNTSTADELDLVEASLGYEGDTHPLIWPTSKTIWLDENRKLSDLDSNSIKDYALGRIETLKQFKINSRITSSSRIAEKGLLFCLDEEALKSAANDSASKDPTFQSRETMWLNRLKELHPELQPRDWGVIIVGSKHIRLPFLGELESAGFVTEQFKSGSGNITLCS